MSLLPRTHVTTLPLSMAERVDVVCDRFEAAWGSGVRPRIGDYLEGVEEPERAVLARELILLDLHYRHRRAEVPQVTDYDSVNPDRESTWLDGAVAALTEGSTPPVLPGYEILGELGRGGMSVVYRARQKHPDRIVALKMILAGAHAGSDRRTRLLAEADAIARLRLPNIVQIYEVGLHEGVPFLALEYAEGGSLAQMLAGTPQPCQAAAALVEVLARTVHQAHAQGIIHRDLKPANVLLTGEGIPKISDFGLAKILAREPQLTSTQAVLGTPSYMAPEQAAGKTRAIGPSADVYALGTILYECLTGRPPFHAGSPLDTLHLVVTQQPTPPSRLRRGIPRDLETICLKCLEKEPSRRYASAAALAEDLRRFQAGESVLARPVGRMEGAWRWCRRHPPEAALIAAVATFLCVAALGIGLTNVWLRHERDLALKAKEDALAKLRQSYLDQARLGRLNPEAGEGSRCLSLLAEAARIEPGLDLRTEAIAWLARPDLHRVREWEGDPKLSGAAFDSKLARYARSETKGELTVRRVADDEVLARLPLAGHGFISGAQILFSPNGRYLASTCPVGDNVMGFLVWDLESAKQILRAATLHHGVGLAFMPDSSAIASLTNPDVIWLYDLPSGQKRLSVKTVARANQLMIDPSNTRLAISSAEDRVAEIYDLATGMRSQRLAHPAGVMSIGWSHDGQKLATGGADNVLYLWDLTHSQLLADMPGHQGQIIHCAFESQDERIVTASWDGTCRWRGSTPAPVASLDAGSWAYPADDSQRLAIRNVDRLGLWQRVGPDILRGLRLKLPRREGRLTSTPVIKLTTGPGDILAVVGADGVHIWSVNRGQEIGFLPLPGCSVAQFDPPNRCLVAYGREGLYRWNIQYDGTRFQAAKAEKLPVNVEPSNNYDLQWASDGRALLLNDSEGSRAISLHFDEGMRVEELGRLSRLSYVTCSPDGRWIALGAWQGDGIKIWDAQQRALVFEIPGSRAGASSARPAFSPDGNWLIACCQQEYRFFACGSWQQLFELKRNPIQPSPGPLAFQPHGNLLALVASPGEVMLLDRRAMEKKATLVSPVPIYISDVCFDADGTHLAVGTAQNGVQWWDLEGLRTELQRIGLDWMD